MRHLLRSAATYFAANCAIAAANFGRMAGGTARNCRSNSSATISGVSDRMYASARRVSFHSALPFGSTQGPSEGNAQSPRQGVQIFVDGPQSRVRSEKYGGKDGQIYRTAAQVLKLFSLDQFKSLFGGRDNGLLQPLQIAKGTLTRGWGRSAAKFQHDQRVTRHLRRRQQLLKQ